MSDLTTIKEQVYDDVVAVVNLHVNNPHQHVIRENDDEPDSPPMVALNASTGSTSEGLHGSRVLEIYSGPFDVLYGKKKTMSVDVTISDVDGDRADTILDEIQNQFTYDNRVRDPQALLGTEHPPIEEIEVRDMSPTSRDQRLGHALVVEIEYYRTYRHSDLANPPSEVEKVEQSYDGVSDSLDFKVVTTSDGTTIEEI